MFETGQHDLPLPAKQLLSELLSHMLSFDATNSKAATHQISQEQLERQFRENEYQQMVISRKIAAITKKQAAQARLLHLSNFLKVHAAYKNASPQLHQAIAAKAIPEREAEFSVPLIKLQHQLETLAIEKQWLASKMLGRR